MHYRNLFLIFLLTIPLRFFAQNLIPFEKDGKWGYVNKKNIVQIIPKFQAAQLFTDNMGIVLMNEKYGIINSKNTIIPFEHDYIEYLENGFFKTGDRGKYFGEYKYGIVNAQNQTIIEKKFSSISLINDLFIVRINKDSIMGKSSVGDIRSVHVFYGLFDLKGKVIIPPQYDNLEWINKDLIIISKNDKQAFYTSKGRPLTDFNYARSWIKFNNGLSTIIADGKCGYIDQSVKEVTPISFQVCHPFYDNYALVEVNNQYGLINKSGKQKIFFKYNFVRNYFSGTAIARSNNKWILVDTMSKELTQPYNDIIRAYDGVIAVKKNSKWAIIDNTGKLLTDFIFDEVKIVENDDLHITSFWLQPFKFDQGYLLVMNNNKWGIANKEGRLIIKTEYDAVSSFKKGIAYVKKDKKWAIADSIGNFKTVFQYDYLQSDFYGFNILEKYNVIVFGKGQLSGFINPFGKEIIPPTYNEIKPADDGYFLVVLDKKWGIIDSNGKEIIKPKYDFIKLQKNNSRNGNVFNNDVCIVQKNGKWFYTNKNGTEYKIEE